MVEKPFKVKSSSSEHFERSYLETDVGSRKATAGGGLFACRSNQIKIRSNMIDINKQNESKPFQWKEGFTNLLFANIPATIIVVTLKQFGLQGVVPILIVLFGFYAIISHLRKRWGNVASNRTVIYAIIANIIAFVVLPVIMLGIFS